MIFSERYLSSVNATVAESYTEIIRAKPKSKSAQSVTISSENNKQTIELTLNNLVCIKSDGNYVEVYYWKDGEIKHELIRNSLSKITNQLETYECMVRCHRSYLINFNKVERVSGNARNFNLHVEGLGFLVPVSRSFPKALLEEIKR